MAHAGEAPVAFSRLLEIAQQADRQGRCRFTPFLTPPEAELAEAAAKRANVDVVLFGGYDDAERRMARFTPPFTGEEPFPVKAMQITWFGAQAPQHRDLLGSVMGLGVQRSRIGDIVLLAQEAYLFAEQTLAEVIAQSLLEAGRISLSVRVLDTMPALENQAGEAKRGTVASPRLDAVVAEGFHLSRGAAAELITAGNVKLRHAPVLRPDARVEAGDAISVRGHGRLRVDAFGDSNRKGRFPILYTRFGAVR